MPVTSACPWGERGGLRPAVGGFYTHIPTITELGLSSARGAWKQWKCCAPGRHWLRLHTDPGFLEWSRCSLRQARFSGQGWNNRWVNDKVKTLPLRLEKCCENACVHWKKGQRIIQANKNLSLFTYCHVGFFMEHKRSFPFFALGRLLSKVAKICWKCAQVIQNLHLSSSDLEKSNITSLAHQWILCSEWVPSEWESKQLIKTSQ